MAQVTVVVKGLSQTLSHLSTLQEKIPQNIEKKTAQFGKDSQEYLKSVTPVRSGTLRTGDTLSTQSMGFKLSNTIRYVGWVEEGHRTRSYFRRHGRIVPARRVTQVAGRHFFKKTLAYIEGEAKDRYNHLLED